MDYPHDILNIKDYDLDKILAYERQDQNNFIYHVTYNASQCEKPHSISFDEVDGYSEKRGRDL